MSKEDSGADYDSYWWCQRCGERVEPERVRYDEKHDGCGGVVVWRVEQRQSSKEGSGDE